MSLRRARWRDVPWLCAVGLDPEKVGRQYHVAEAPLQLVVAPARALLAAGTRRPAAVVEVEGRRAGYIGPNPLSGNIEYFLQPWARGGTGSAVVSRYLGDFRGPDRQRRFFVAAGNERSLATLHSAFRRLGWQEHSDWWASRARHGTHVHVRATR